MSATLGLDDSAYRQGVEEAKSQTKAAVSTMMKDYNRLYSEVIHLTAAYQKSRKETGETSEKTKEFAQKLKEAQAQLNTTSQGLRTAEGYMSSFGEAASGSSKSLAGAIAQGTVMAGVFSKLYAAALSAAKGFISSGIEYNAQIEKYTTGFTNMLGSAEAAQQVMSQIQEDAAKTPFDVESLTKANQYLISAGENASYARNTIMALGDAVSATGGGNDELNRMAQNLQQIANTGKATAVDIKQFAYAGINVYGILADYTGKSTAEVQNMTISYDLLTQALQAASEEGGRYYNSMDTQSQTMNGRVSTLKDNVSQLAGLLTGDLSSGVGVVIGNLNDLIVKAQEAYKTDGWIGLAGAITGLTEPINTAKNAFKDFASKATTWLDQLSYKLNRFLGKAATADFDVYEEYADANNRKSNRNRLRQNALSGKSVSNKSWSERQAELAAAAGNGGSSITTTATGKKSTGKKSTTETVIASVSNTVTTSAMNALGAVTTSVETLQEKVKDSAGKIKDRVTTTTTETGKEMVNGVATTFKRVETKVNGTVTKVTKTYDDMSKTLLGTFTNVSETTFNGITTKVQQAVEKYADGSEHIKKTVTETGQRIGDNGAETYEKIVTYVDGVKDKVTETATAVDNSVKGMQSRIEQYLSGASEESGKGIFGIIKNTVNDAKNQDWGGIALDITNLIWGEVSQGQREVISKWFVDAMGAVNEAYSGGGLSNAFDAVKAIFGDGITKNADGVTMAIKGVTTEVKSLGEIVNGLAGSGGVGGAIGSIIQSFSGMAGGITSALGGIVSFVAANPILALILGFGVVAGGIGLAAWASSRKNKAPVSHYRSPFEDAGVYDSLSEFSTRAALQYRVTGQQSIVDRQTSILERIEGMLDEHLPDIGKGQVVMDSGELVGVLSPRMATNVDARIGVTVTRKARGV